MTVIMEDKEELAARLFVAAWQADWSSDSEPWTDATITYVAETSFRVAEMFIAVRERHRDRKPDASVTAEQAAEYVRKERERNANRDRPIPRPKDGFINDYD